MARTMTIAPTSQMMLFMSSLSILDEALPVQLSPSTNGSKWLPFPVWAHGPARSGPKS